MASSPRAPGPVEEELPAAKRMRRSRRGSRRGGPASARPACVRESARPPVEGQERRWSSEVTWEGRTCRVAGCHTNPDRGNHFCDNDFTGPPGARAGPAHPTGRGAGGAVGACVAEGHLERWPDGLDQRVFLAPRPRLEVLRGRESHAGRLLRPAGGGSSPVVRGERCRQVHAHQGVSGATSRTKGPSTSRGARSP